MKTRLIDRSWGLGVVLAMLLASTTLSARGPEDLSKAEIAELGKRATALVEAQRRYYGSAFCVHPSGLFVTNNHVLENGTSELYLVLNTGLPGQARLKASVVRRDDDLDLALLRVEGAKELPTLTLGSTKGLHELMDVVAFGYPFGRDLAAARGEYPTVSVNMGNVSSLRRKDGELTRIQLDAAVSPGNSGGPLLDLKGTVVGVIVGRVEARFGAGIDLAIPVNHVSRFLARPDIVFEPPAECAGNEAVEFRARAISLLPSATRLHLELILSSGLAEERRYPMKFADDVY
jgi:S1-C subfamily serine protease